MSHITLKVNIPTRYMTVYRNSSSSLYGGWNFNSGNYLFTTDTK